MIRIQLSQLPGIKKLRIPLKKTLSVTARQSNKSNGKKQFKAVYFNLHVLK